MKKYFMTGLVILLPVALTLAIVVFFFNLLTVPFLSVVKAVFEKYHLFAHGWLVFTSEGVQNLFAQILILFSLILFTILLGMIARWFFFRALLRIADRIVHRIPLVSSVYKTCQEIIKTVFTTGTKSFKQVVLVRFPNPATYSIGLITREDLPAFQSGQSSDAVAVFVPTTPNPTSGFLILYKKTEIIYLDMKVEDAFKFIISCGVILPSFNAANSQPVKEASFSHEIYSKEETAS